MNLTSATHGARRVKRILLAKFSGARCRVRGHRFGAPIAYHGQLFFRCAECGAQTEPFVVYTPLRGQR